MDIIRVGDDFFKFVEIEDVNGQVETKMLPIKRQTILDDYGKDYIKTILKYAAFVNVPDNDGKAKLRSNVYNLYTQLNHSPRSGDWKWTRILLQHVFGDQYELGLDYIQLIYQRPLQLLPVLSLVSKENQTGKTTFLNWLRFIFKDNMIVIGNQEISSQFNWIYAYKLIIAIEESRIERASAQEKIKAMATQTKAVMNEKFQRSHTVDYFGKLILVSNHEDNFISANKEDIRYWIRKVPKIPAHHNNFDIEEDLRKEVPAFLYYLNRRELSTKKESRAWFAIDLIETDALNNVRAYSHTPLYFDLKEGLNSFFAGHPNSNRLRATAKMLIDNVLPKNNQYNTKYLSKVLKDEFEMTPTSGRFTEEAFNWFGQPGNFYTFEREVSFTDENANELSFNTNVNEAILPF
jgi:hypothetical protein